MREKELKKRAERGENDVKGKEKRFEHWQIMAAYLVIYDIFAVNFSYFLGLLLRFDFSFTKIPTEYIHAMLRFAPIYTVFCLAVFWVLKLYNSLWAFASYTELNHILLASIITTLFNVGITMLCKRMPASYYIVGAVMQFCLITGIRFGYRYITLERTRMAQVRKEQNHTNGRNIMVIGAGDAGKNLVRELKTSRRINGTPQCIIDDNRNKWGRNIEDVPIVGGRASIFSAVEKYQISTILFAIPTASAEAKREILNLCKETKCELKILPGAYQFVQGEVSLAQIKDVTVEDLLGRDTIQVDMEQIFQYIKGKTILVTGGGGSIGSELCRQIASHEPKQLILFDIYENNAYAIEQELRRNHSELNLVTLIGSVRDSRRLNQVFKKYKPDIVYHAAAHKHVPLMETSPNEAIKNNVIGTYKTAYAAMQNGVKRFVLISTDKAVNPTNIMGASKRLCEMVIQSMDAVSKSGRMDLLPLLHGHRDNAEELAKQAEICLKKAEKEQTDGKDSETMGNTARLKIESIKNRERTGTQFVAVRFGNVLGSNGSVIPLFKKQIEAGGPVTVTHPDIIRYFMTIPEAVSLVLQAGTFAWGGEIFVLDMGEPVKIDTLARNLIKLSGYEPDVDIKIEYSGLRPGEKLFEEKLMAEEGIMRTDNELIHIGKPIPFDTEVFFEQLKKLADTCYNNSDHIVELVGGSEFTEDGKLRRAINTFTEKYNAVVIADTYANIYSDNDKIFNPKALGDTITADQVKYLAPDLIISFGAVYYSTIKYFMPVYSNTTEHWQICIDGMINDGYHCLKNVFEMKPEEFFERVNVYADTVNNGEYAVRWKKRMDIVHFPELGFTNLAVIKEFCKTIPDNSLLHTTVLDSIRMSNYVEMKPSIRCFANIGADGIDGALSTYLGQGESEEKPVYLLIGDLSLMYDMNALLQKLPHNIRIVVINNYSGAEFHKNFGLDRIPTLNKHIAAGHRVKIANCCINSQFKYLAATNMEEVREALTILNTESEKPILLEVFTDADKDAKILKSYWMTNRQEIPGMKLSGKARVKQIVRNILGNKAYAIREMFKK